MVRSFILAAAASMALGACATQTADNSASGAAPRGDCFSSRSINGFNPIDDTHLQLTVGASQKYILTTNTRMHGINFEERIAVESTSGWICTGNGLEVELHTGGDRAGNFPQTYYVNEIVRAPEVAPQGS